MGLTAFQKSGSIDWCAAAEQATLHDLLYNQGTDSLTTAAKGAGDWEKGILVNETFPDWTSDPKGMPRFKLWKQGGQNWIAIAGTYTVAQWVGNVLGVIVKSTLGTDVGAWQGYWASIASALLKLIDATEGDHTVPLNVSGYSLGGAVGIDLAYLAHQKWPTRQVSCLTFGCPRPRIGDSTQRPTGAAWYDVQTQADPVVQLPPNAVSVPGLDWQQVGAARFVVSLGGAQLNPDTNAGELLSLKKAIAALDFSPHRPDSYATGVVKYYKTLAPCASTDALLTAAASIPPPNQGKIPDRGLMPAFPVHLGGAEAIDPITGGGLGVAYWRCQFHFVQGSAKWSETYHFDGGTEDPDGNLAVAKSLARVRCGLLASETDNLKLFPNPILESVTIGNPLVTRQAQNFPLGYSGTMEQPAGLDLLENQTSGERGARFLFFADKKTRRSAHTLVGIPSGWSNFSFEAQVDNTTLVGGLAKAANAWLSALVGKPGPKLAGLGNYLVKSPTYVAPPAGASKITAVYAALDGGVVLTVPGHAIDPFTRIKVQGLRGDSSVGINGTAVVMDVAGDDLFLNKVFCRQCDFTLRAPGKVLVAGAAATWSPLVEGWFQGWGDRQVGRNLTKAAKKKNNCCA